MPTGRRAPNNKCNVPPGKELNVGHVLTEAIKKNIKLLAVIESRDDSDIVREAIIEYFRQLGIDATKTPTLTDGNVDFIRISPS